MSYLERVTEIATDGVPTGCCPLWWTATLGLGQAWPGYFSVSSGMVELQPTLWRATSIALAAADMIFVILPNLNHWCFQPLLDEM